MGKSLKMSLWPLDLDKAMKAIVSVSREAVDKIMQKNKRKRQRASAKVGTQKNETRGS
jgi:hypothetical protein